MSDPSRGEKLAGLREKLVRLKPWALPALALALALIAVIILFGKMRRDVWAYYTDGESIRTDAHDERARPVLWQDKELQHFDEKEDSADAPNAPTGTLEAAFSADGASMVLVRWAKDGGKADMYRSDWDGRTWSPPQPIESVNTEANERSPALSGDGRFLYFASDREGGLGGYDLYVASWDGGKWTGVQSLPSSVNTAANELGPALSADGALLYLSSDRNGEGEDIFVAKITAPEKTEGKETALPEFAEAEAVDDLNSKAADVQAALTHRGDHVFIASDRDRDQKSGFKLYISRVIDGEPLPPEEVDLYIKEGDVTDPAVRMDGFDLLFSSREAAGDGDDSGYQLYRSTTREVVGYTDSSRWEEFKNLMGDIAWWIVLAVAALIALIYILEKWRDMTTLFHKCLAGSAVLHLLALLTAMVWLIAQQIEDEDASKQEVSINIDALAEEDLAMESVPEEAELTETTTNLETEKVEAEFGAPGFEEQNDAQPMPEAAPSVKEAMLVEAQPAMSDPTERPVTEPAQEASLLSDLTETALPTVDTPVLEESDPTQPREVADLSQEKFEPEIMVTETEKTETREVADAAVESEADTTDVTEVHEPQPLADAPKESVVEATPQETPTEAPAETTPLESTMLSELELAHFVDPAEMSLDEGKPEAVEAPADPSEDVFSPDSAVASLNSSPTQSEAVADSAMESSADAASVAASESASNASAIDAVASTVGAASVTEESLPPSELDAGELGGLPELALTDPGAPMLEEPETNPTGAPATPSDDLFKPDQSVPSLTTAPAESESVADSALATQADVAAVTGGELVAGSPVIESRPPDLAASAPAESMPPTATAPAELGSLPEVAMVDPGAPKLEEAGDQPAGAPANPAEDVFKPGGTAPNLATSQAQTSTVADTAVTDASAPTAVDRGGIVANSAVAESRPPERPGSAQVENIPPTGKVEAGLPELSLVDAGAPQLDEGDKPPGAPADVGKDQFTPGGSVPNLATAPAAGHPVSDKAVTDPGAAAAVADAKRDTAAGGSALAPTPLEAVGGVPNLDAQGIAAELAATTPMASLLPSELEVDRALDPKGMATLIQKQRGKPGIDTIKQMGGSDGTEMAISAAIEWLVKNQEKDGRWDTAKHGANLNYDSGGAGLALLCFYGWGERHDQACQYQQSVRRALDWLLEQQNQDGYLGGAPGKMYSHAIATIALCEAYGLTKDQRLKAPADRAIAYTLAAQSKSRGGWRYSPGEGSDTSVTGWQLMALHSARMAGIAVPEEAFERARKFLDQIGGGRHGGLYGYTQRGEGTAAMVATGMFCRQLDLVPPSHPMMQESARRLKLNPIRVKPDLYYVYYATLALYQHQGPIWVTWNERLKATLLSIQSKDGSWGKSDRQAAEGGLVISTALATLSLEVYYRLLPMYGFRNDEADAPEAKQKEN